MTVDLRSGLSTRSRLSASCCASSKHVAYAAPPEGDSLEPEHLAAREHVPRIAPEDHYLLEHAHGQKSVLCTVIADATTRDDWPELSADIVNIAIGHGMWAEDTEIHATPGAGPEQISPGLDHLLNLLRAFLQGVRGWRFPSPGAGCCSVNSPAGLDASADGHWCGRPSTDVRFGADTC